MCVAVVQCIEKTDRHYVLAIDAGQSMQLGGVLGCELLTPLVASAAMAMLFVRSEPSYQLVAMANALEPLDIRCASSLNDICAAVSEVCVLSSSFASSVSTFVCTSLSDECPQDLCLWERN